MKIILGTPLSARPKPWLYFRVPAVMVNAYDVLRSKLFARDHSIKNWLQYDGEVWMDSGGYQFLKHGITPNLNDIARVYDHYWDVRYYLNLDYPPSPSDDEFTARDKLKASMSNFEVLVRRFDNVVPVIHYHWSTGVVLEYLRKYLDYNPECIAIGGLVPYILVIRGVPRNSRRNALSFLREVRREFRGCIHVLGLGSPILNPILRAIGIDSTDTSTWRLKAAYGKVIMPGGGERHVSGRQVNFGRRVASLSELLELRDYLFRTGFPLVDRFDDVRGSFEYRALVNAWVVLTSFEEPRHGVFRRIYQELTS
ncbi:hypothetical protein [Vulcanisaeta thermophila]|uniref:hypothetical protein n=1 Tax=Vulcanisaeta thermophila TaxID=867917 RepID=UPI0008534B2D|nr:hypothetical protein [Vulcanisaeta thermophila]